MKEQNDRPDRPNPENHGEYDQADREGAFVYEKVDGPEDQSG